MYWVMLKPLSATSSELIATRAAYFSASSEMLEKVGLLSEMVPPAATDPAVDVAVTVGMTSFSPEVVLNTSEWLASGRLAERFRKRDRKNSDPQCLHLVLELHESHE
jgi:hypothetical protein